MSAMWPQSPDHPRRRPGWATVLAVLGWMLILGCVALAFFTRPVLP